MSYKKQELFTLREHLSSPPVFGGVCIDNLFSFFVLPCCVSLRSGLCVVLSVAGRSCLVCVVCVGLHVVGSDTYCVVFLFCLSSSCVPCDANFSGLSIFDYPFGIPEHLSNTDNFFCLNSNVSNLYNNDVTIYNYFMPVQGTIKTIDPRCWR